MAQPLPIAWSQQEFDDWFAELSAGADDAADTMIKTRAGTDLQTNVQEWLDTGSTTSPLPRAWSSKEFDDWMKLLQEEADEVWQQFILSRTPPELQGVMLERIGMAPRPAWAWPDEQLAFHLDFRNQRYYSRSLGEISAAQAFVATRTSNSNLAFDATGLLVQFAANTPRIAQGRGLWLEGSGAGRIDFNDDLSNAAWVKTGMTVAQNLPSPFATGTPLGWRITATAPNATIMQTADVVAPAQGAGGSDLIVSSLFHLPAGATLAGDVQLTQDGGTSWTSVKSQLIEGKWINCPGSVQANPGTGPTCGVRLTNAGDTLGVMLPNIDRGYLMGSPIRVPSNTATSRGAEQCMLNMASFPPLHNSAMPRFTILVVVEPMQVPLPAPLDPLRPRLGWTALEFNDADTITFEGRGSITNDVMTVTQADIGTVVIGHRLLTGSGALSFTDIKPHGGGTTGTGGVGTYNVHSSLSGTGAYPPTQTTPADIVLKARLKDAQGYGHNSAIKLDADQQIGVTFSNELVDLGPGLDPQVAEFTYNAPNAMGWSMDTARTPAPKAHIALKGDVYTSTDVELFASPQLNPGCYIMVGSQGGATSPTGPLRGLVRDVICVARAYDAAEMATATDQLQAAAGS